MIRSRLVIEFLKHPLQHVGGKVLIVWDGLPAHRSRAVWEFVRQQHPSEGCSEPNRKGSSAIGGSPADIHRELRTA
jgi:hypothetical protein